MPLANTQKLILVLLLGAAVLMPAVAAEDESDSPVAGCLKAWGKHPFGRNPQFKTLSTAVKVFGIGRDTEDTEATKVPALVLVNPGVNVAGGNVVQVLNPNGWYCFRTSVNVMGGLTIKAHCKTHLATTSGDVLGKDHGSEDKNVTVLGSSQVERVGCN
jgi:hypothetical protein